MKISPTIVNWFYVVCLWMVSGNTLISAVLGGLIVYAVAKSWFWVYILSGAGLAFFLLTNRWAVLRHRELLVEELEKAQEMADNYFDDDDDFGDEE